MHSLVSHLLSVLVFVDKSKSELCHFLLLVLLCTRLPLGFFFNLLFGAFLNCNWLIYCLSAYTLASFVTEGRINKTVMTLFQHSQRQKSSMSSDPALISCHVSSAETLTTCYWPPLLLLVVLTENKYENYDLSPYSRVVTCAYMHVLRSVFIFSSAYEQKRAAGGAKSSCPGTPMSPMQQHYSPKPATAGRPDAGYMNPAATSQPLPSNSYPINTRWHTGSDWHLPHVWHICDYTGGCALPSLEAGWWWRRPSSCQ